MRHVYSTVTVGTKEYLVSITKDDQEQYIVRCPPYPECQAQGNSIHQSLATIREQILIYREQAKRKEKQVA